MYCCVQKCLYIISKLCQINVVYNFLSYLFKIDFIFTMPSMILSSKWRFWFRVFHIYKAVNESHLQPYSIEHFAAFVVGTHSLDAYSMSFTSCVVQYSIFRIFSFEYIHEPVSYEWNNDSVTNEHARHSAPLDPYLHWRTEWLNVHISALWQVMACFSF